KKTVKRASKKKKAKVSKKSKRRKARKRASRKKSRGRPLFKVRRVCGASGCRKVVYARRPRNKSEVRRLRKMRNKVVAAQIRRRRAIYGY
ncbi:MAG: hypothetical protein AAFO75_10300, partial [Pseudomonadota bacterium]